MPGLEEHLGGAGRGAQAVTSGCLCQVLLPGGFTSVWWLGFAHCIAIIFLSRRAPVGRKKPPTPNQPMAGCCQLSPLALRSALPAAWSFVSPFLCPQGLAVLQALPATNPPKSWLLVVPELPWGDGVERAEPGAPRPAAQGGSVRGDACSGAGASISPLVFFLSGE